MHLCMNMLMLMDGLRTMKIKWKNLPYDETVYGRVIKFIQTPEGTKALVITDKDSQVLEIKIGSFEVVSVVS